MTGELSAKVLLARVWELSERLEENSIWHEIRVTRFDGVTIFCHLPGQYWEIDFLEDGRVDVERYRSIGDVQTESAIEQLVSEYGEPRQRVRQTPASRARL